MNTTEFLSEKTGVDFTGVTNDARLDLPPGWDSVAMVNLVVALEEHMGRMLEFEEIDGLVTVADVQQLLTDGAS